MKKTSLIILTVAFVLLSWWQGRLIVESVRSLIAFVLIGLTHFSWPGAYWRPALAEHWIAAIVWTLTGVWLTLALVREFKRPPLRARGARYSFLSHLTPARRKGLWVLVATAYVSLVCPFLVRVGPEVQGNLVTTRFLPPLSTGSVQEAEPDRSASGDRVGLAGQYAAASSYILQRTVAVSGAREPGSSPVVFILGTDDAARDVLSRVVYGTRVSLGIGLLAALGSIIIGSIVGFAAGLSRGILDAVLMRLTDLFLAIPGLFLVIALVAFLGQSVVTVIVVLALTGWMGVARMVRGEVLTLREKEFVITARMLRVSSFRIITRHLYPNVRPVIVTAAVLQFGSAVLAEAALGFLGLGIQPPTASWGNMMGEAVGSLHTAWWLGFFPGVLLAAVIVSAHFVGESAE